ncbi:hypothetical protein MNBD_NITROSPINAE03-81 [hydrothermal vent metagenome]|uniref:ATP-grasp domain-containing protein n=1 Tax=hydrothermal vent metagenome TaxID=652676 RepID=A0A3B1CIM8_9ZZZZ
MVKVLISGSGTATCQGVIKGLLKSSKKHDVEIHTMDTNPLSAGRFFGDKFHKIPPAGEEGFINAVKDIVIKEKINIIFPIVDYEFEKLTLAIECFEKHGCKIVISPISSITICQDKRETFKFFMALSIPSPKTESFCRDNLSHFKYPVIVKPAKGRASIDVFKISNYREADCILDKNLEEMIVQEYISGDEITIDFVCDFNGSLLACVPRYRVETKSGVSYKGVTFYDPEIIDYVQKIVNKLDYIGPGNIQCFKTNKGYQFIEINPRFSGGLPLSIEAGMNSPEMMVNLYMGEDVKPSIGKYKQGLYMMRYWEEVFIDENNY